MKKFLSYVLTFISLFAISAIVTIRTQLDDFTNQPTTNAGASGQTTLLAGVMQSIEDNPKLDINGDISLKYQETDIVVGLNVNLDLTTLTNPDVMGSVSISVAGQRYDILITYKDETIYLAYGNMAIESKISGIEQISGMIASLTGQTLSLPNIQLPEINLDSIMAAINNPIKLTVEDTTYYTIVLENIAKITIACDQDFNILALSVNEIYLIDDLELTCDFVVNQDQNINISAPVNGQYLDVASLIENLIALKDNSMLRFDAWTSIYKSNVLFERVDTIGFASMPNGSYQLKNKLSGALDANVNLAYQNNNIYASLNDISISATIEDIGQILGYFDSDQVGEIMNNSSEMVDKLVQWLSQNYMSVIENATVASNQIVINLPVGEILGQSQPIKIELGIEDNQINKISISRLEIGEYMVYTTIYITENFDYQIEIDQTKYYQTSKLLEVYEWAKQLQVLQVSTNLTLDIGNQTLPIILEGTIDFENGNQALQTSLFGLPIAITQQDGVVYIKVNDILISANLDDIYAVLNKFLPQDKISEAINYVSRFAQNLTINDILSLANISTTSEEIRLQIDLSQLLNEDIRISLSIGWSDKLEINIDELVIDNIQLSGTIIAESITQNVDIEDEDQYLNIENLVDYIDEFVTSPELTVAGQIDFSGYGIDEQFDGQISIDFATFTLAASGKISGKINADISVIYQNDVIYVSYNKQYFKLGKSQLVSLLGEFNIDILPIINKISDAIDFKNSLSIKQIIAGLMTEDAAIEQTNKQLVSHIKQMANSSLSDMSITMDDIYNIVSIIEQIQISNNNLNLSLALFGANVELAACLDSSIQLNVSVSSKDMQVGVNLEIKAEIEDISICDDYINLDLVVPRIIAIKNTLNCNNFSGKMFIKPSRQSKTYIATYALNIDIENLFFEFTLNTQIEGLNIGLYVSTQGIYLKVDNIFVSITTEQLVNIISQLFSEQIQEISDYISSLKDISTDQILAKVEEATSTTIIANLYNNGLTSYITLFSGLQIILSGDETLSAFMIKYDDIEFSVSISATTGDSIVTKPNAETYLNVVDFVTKLNGWINSSTYAIGGEFDFSGFGIDEKFVGEIAIDFANLAIIIDGTLSGKLNADIQLSYINERVYVSYNKQHFTISETELVKLLNEFGIDISDILAKVKEMANIKNNFTLTNMVNELLGISILDEENTNILGNMNIDQIVEIISKINLNSQSFAFNGNILDYNINLNLSFGAKIATNIEIGNEKMALSVNSDIAKQVKQDIFDVVDEYYNLDNISTILSAILNTIQDTQFNGNLSLNFGTSEFEQVELTYDINIVEGKINAEFSITYLGQTAMVYVIDNQLFVGVKGVFITATIEQIIEILQAELPSDIKQKIDDAKEQLSQSTNDIFKTIEDIANSEFIDNLEITPNKLTIELLGICAEVNANNDKLSSVNISYNSISANISITSSQNSQAIEVDADAYIDIDNVYNLVKNVYNYAISGEYYYDINLSALGYNVTGYVAYNQGLVAHLQTTILGKAVVVDISDETLYVNFDGFVAHIAFEKIPALLGELNTQLDLNIPQYVLDIVDKLFVTKDFALEDVINIASGKEPINWQTLLEDIAINLYSDKLTVRYDMFDAEVSLINNMISQLLVKVSLDEQNVSATIKLCDEQTFATPNAGLDVADITGLLKYISKLVKTTNYSGTFSFDYKEISLEGQYGLEIRDNQISAKISTTFYDLPISVVVVDNIVYAQIDKVKISLPLSQINDLMEWINASFNQTLSTDLNISTSIDNSGDISLDGITFGDIILSIVGNVLSASYQDVSATISIADVSNIALTYKDISASLTIDTTTEQIVAPQGYLPYTDFTDIVDSLLDLYNSGKISATAQGFVYEGEDLHYTADCALQIDINAKQIFISVAVCDLFENSNIDIMLAYRDNYWFVDYNNLKLKICSTDLKEILAILLEVVGIDPSLLPFLSDVVGGLDVNTDSLSALVPELDFGNPLTLIDVFEKISLKQGELSVEVDNSLIAGNLNSENIFAVLKTQNNKLSYIALNNLYTGTTDYEKLDFTLSLKDFEQVSEPYQGNYIDLSGANELIKAIINTAELDYFEITATIDVDMTIGLVPISMSVPMDVKIRLDENRKPEIMISLGDIPVLKILGFNINNDIGVSIENRMWYIYYKDSYIYMLRHDEASKKVYQKELKVHVDSFFDDFFYYLQWGVGFDDWVMDEIEKALALTDGYTPDLGKVINDFTVTDSRNFSIDINMEEVSNNPQIDNMIVDLGVVNNEQTNNKNYIGTAEFYLNMPVATGVTIKLVSEDMQLINIGQPFDFTDFEKFVYNYVGIEGTEYGREWSTSNGTAWDYDGAEWQLASEREYTITFDSQGGEAVSAITGKTNQEITLPTLANKVVVDVEAGIRYTYTFGGWYQTELCKNGTEFESTTMPKKNMTLYAKWVLAYTEQVVSITFDSNGGTTFDSISGYAGSQVDISGYVPTKATTYEDKGYNWVGSHVGRWTYVYTHYTFAGWYIDSACTTKFDGILPNENATLYAKWTTTTETKYHLSWERP